MFNFVVFFSCKSLILVKRRFNITQGKEFVLVLSDGTEIVEDDFLMLQEEETRIVFLLAGEKLEKQPEVNEFEVYGDFQASSLLKILEDNISFFFVCLTNVN